MAITMRKTKKIALEAIKNIQKRKTTMRKTKQDALEAIKNIQKMDKIKMHNVEQTTNPKPKAYSNQSKWLDSVEFDTLASKGSNALRKESPNSSIKETKKQLLMQLEEMRKRVKELEYALAQSESAAQKFAFEASEAEIKAKRLAILLAKDMNDSGKMLSRPKKRKIDAESSQPRKKHNTGNFFDSDYQSKLEIIETTEQLDDLKKELASSNDNEARKTKRKTRKRKKTDSQTSSTLPPTNKRSRIDIYGGGITNPRFQCYINTAIQLLTQCPGFQNDIYQFFHENQEHLNQPLNKDGKLYQRLTFAEGLL